MDRLPTPDLPPRIARQLPEGVRQVRLQLDDVAVHLLEAGDPAGRPVLMVHGNPTWAFVWRKVIARLEGAPLRLIAPDLPGLGLSDRLPADWHELTRYRRWMGQLVDALGLEDTIVVAQDWGGACGLLPFADRPGRLAGVVLCNTVISEPRPGFRPTAFHRFARLPGVSDLVFRGAGFPQRVLGLAWGDGPRLSADEVFAYTWPLQGWARSGSPLALARMVPDGPYHPSMAPLRDLGAFVRGFAGPAALVWGDRDPILGGVRSHVERTLPQAVVWRTQAGHFPQEEVPEVVADAIRHVASTLDGDARPAR